MAVNRPQSYSFVCHPDFNVTSETIQEYTTGITRIQSSLSFHLTNSQNFSSYTWSILEQLTPTINKITQLTQHLRDTNPNASPEISHLLTQEEIMKTQCLSMLNIATIIAHKEEELFIYRYTPLFFQYLQTRQGNDLIAARNHYESICSNIDYHNRMLTAFENAFKTTPSIQVQNPQHKTLALIYLHLFNRNPIAQALQLLEQAVTGEFVLQFLDQNNPTPNQRGPFVQEIQQFAKAIAPQLAAQFLTSEHKATIDQAITNLQHHLGDIHPSLKTENRRYNNLSQLHRLICEAALHRGIQILKKCHEVGMDEEFTIQKLYERIGSPAIKSNPMEWMRNNFHYYLDILESLLLEQQARQNAHSIQSDSKVDISQNLCPEFGPDEAAQVE